MSDLVQALQTERKRLQKQMELVEKHLSSLSGTVAKRGKRTRRKISAAARKKMAAAKKAWWAAKKKAT